MWGEEACHEVDVPSHPKGVLFGRGQGSVHSVCTLHCTQENCHTGECLSSTS